MSSELLRQVIKLMCELRGRSFYKELLQKYPNVPEYVMHDIFRGADDPIFAKFNRLSWKQEIIEVNPTDFSQSTQRNFKEREFGEANPYDVPNDEERVKLQRKLAVQGTNEPIIVVKRIDGYDLWEGWHRAMSILKLGDNGVTFSEWNKVKINAWVGSSKK